MILVRLRSWSSISEFTHIATSWQLASDEEFTDILEEITESELYLEHFFSTIEVPDDVTYYVKAKRHFDTSEIEYWTDPIPVTNITKSYDHMLLSEDVYIEEPSINFDKSTLLSNASTITITTSKFKSNVDSHLATHWIIIDGYEDVLFSSLQDTENLTSITIDNDSVYSNKTEIKIIVIHVGASGAESKAAIRKVKVYSDFKFEISSNITDVDPLTDLVIQFNTISGATSLGIISVELISANSDDVLLELDLASDNTVTIPWYFLKEKMKYRLKITASDVSNRKNVIYKTITVASYSDSVLRKSDMEYSHSLVTSTSDTLHIPNNIYTEELLTSKLLIPNPENLNMKIYNNDLATDVLSDTGETANGIKLLSSNIDYMLIKPITKGSLIIDMYNDEGVPTFSVYNYSYNNDKYTLAFSCSRSDESYPVGKAGGFFQITDSAFIYIPVGTNKLRKYDFVNNAVEDINEVEMVSDAEVSTDNNKEHTDEEGNEIYKYIMTRCRHNRTFVCNHYNNTASIYNYALEQYSKGYTFSPSTFIYQDLKSITLINNSSLIFFNTPYEKSEEEEADITFTDYGDIEYFSYTDSSITTPKLKFEGTYPSSVVILNNGSVYLTANTDNTTEYYKYV